MEFAIVLLVLAAMIIVALIISSIKKALFIKRNKEMILDTISCFYDEFEEMCNSFVCHSQEVEFVKKWKSKYNQISSFSISKNNELYSVVSNFIGDYENLHDMISLRNDMFVANEKVRCDALLSDIDGKSLDDQQRTAVVSDEDNSLVLAGAGSGKTLTIAGKVKYLYEERNINPDDILLISFTNKATEELNERINIKLNVPVQATTFHKLGLDILKKQKIGYCEVYDSKKLNLFIKKYFQNEVKNQPELARALIEYFAYYFNVPSDMENYESLGELFEHEKGRDFETLQSKYEKALYIKQVADEKKREKETLQGEVVKSLEEVTIANFLFLHGVKYEYEKRYPFESEDQSRKKYTPDFYLTDYDLYLEHFGINKYDRLPWLSRFEENKYIADMRWKRKVHKENGTRLLETYSYYAHEGRLLKELNRILISNGVEYKEVDYCKIFEKIYTEQQIDKYFAEFIRLCATFITLFKSNGYATDDLKNRYYKNKKAENEFLVRRAELFKTIISPILEAYEKYLIENEYIDFSDMINNAAKIVEKGCTIHQYKYIIVDEFQDISVARYNLIKAIQSQTGAKTMCVGDDWQSIYRFAGSDISLFTSFEKYFGYTRVMRLENTYRNAQELIDEASKFITKNPMQLRKDLHSEKRLAQPVEFWFFDGNHFDTLEKIVNRIIAEFGSDKSILFLGRTKYDEQMLIESNLFYFNKEHNKEQMIYKASPNTPVTFLSVHKAKGLEADNVVLLNFKNSTLGFPNKIEDDPILELVLSSEDTYEYAEERRVLYVALTRTKNRSYIMVDAQQPSEFLKEFTPSNSVYFTSEMLSDSLKEKVKCPRCMTGFLKIRHNEQTNNYFIGCSNYPRCEYTNGYVSILDSKRKCPICGGFLVKKVGRYGAFLGCSNYNKNPEISCGYTETIEERY